MGSHAGGSVGGGERSSDTVPHESHRRRPSEEGRGPDFYHVLAEPAFPDRRQGPGHREACRVRQACGSQPERGPEDGAGRSVLSLAD